MVPELRRDASLIRFDPFIVRMPIFQSIAYNRCLLEAMRDCSLRYHIAVLMA